MKEGNDVLPNAKDDTVEATETSYYEMHNFSPPG